MERISYLKKVYKDMQRRQFIKVSGAGITGSLLSAVAASVAGLTACGGGASTSTNASGSNVDPVVLPSGTDWTKLANGMQGTVILPASSNYATAALVFNARFNSTRPQAIARCNSPADVSAAITFANNQGVAITPRCGGHSFGGFSTSSGLVIDVGPMNTVQVNSNGTATIGAGAKLADVYSQLIAKGVCIPSGTCLSVGIAGITMGGGIGLLDRQYGLTCDNLVAAQIVNADGKIVDCDADHESELFWALRGGGGGNFGVATSFTFKTHATQNLTTFSASFAFSDAIKVLGAWQSWQSDLPDTIWAQLSFTFFSPGREPTVTIFGCCIGSDTYLAPYWKNLLNVAGKPLTEQVNTSSYYDVAMGFCSGRTVSQCHFIGQSNDATIQPYAFASSSDFYHAPLPAEGMKALLDGISAARTAGIGAQILLNTMGGAIAKVAPDATAFTHRKALFSAEYFMDAPVGSSANWSNEMRQRMQKWTSGGAYVNYIDPLIADWKRAYYGENYARLAQIKQKYDPRNVFRFA
ncbi:MAG: FAD-binding oxidoreductase, partial [Burkholderiaceae bacterium]|nr:FAD-binding oxidoreductase [Burkholderiaceae bacterium]